MSSNGSYRGCDRARFHLAREICALWQEEDAATLARLWMAFVAAHPDRFLNGVGTVYLDEGLTRTVAGKIRGIPHATAISVLGSMRKAPPEEIRTWLMSLSE